MHDRLDLARLATAEDLATVQSLTRTAYAAYVPVLGGWPGPVGEDYAPRIAGGNVYLAECDGAAVGLLVLEHHADHVVIWSVAVHPEHQGRGHGRALLAHAETIARHAGGRELRLFTNARMTRNLALYARLGFRETGRRPHPTRAGFEVVDMARPLD